MMRKIILVALLCSGCSSVQYAAWEQVGVHKRDLLADGVEDTRDSQAETQEELVSAYEQLSTLIGFDGGELEDKYNDLNDAVEKSRDAIEELDDNLESIDRVSTDLFEEWDTELDQYNNQSLRADQEKRLRLARDQYTAMRSRMQTARNRVDPVMGVLEDNVLYLKHSLNAQALASLRDHAAVLEGRVDELIRDMQIAIEEADKYIAQMRAG